MQQRLSRGAFAIIDLAVYALILCLGAVPFLLYEKAPDSLHEDVSYVELAKSLLYNHSYVNNFVTEKVEPPGLPIILAGACATFGCSHDILGRTMPLFLTLGLLVSYEVIRRQRGRLAAAASCLLLISSPALFVFVSSMMWPSYPYFLVSMLVLVLAPKVDTQTGGPRRFLAAALLAFLMVGAIMIQSAGIALIGALLGWCLLVYLRDSSHAWSRLKLIAPAILLAVLFQVFWLQRGSNPPEWSLPGYRQGYFSQLKAKNGNYPELGYASTRDIVARVENNLNEHTRYLLGEVLIRRWISPSWASIGVAGGVILILLGIGCSLPRDDSRLCALYFVAYESIYLFWPWSFETPRFTLPILPLACLYLVEGALALWRWLEHYPRRVGAALLPVCVVLAIFASRQGLAASAGQGYQEKVSAIIWAICAAFCTLLIWKGSLPPIKLPPWAHNLAGSYRVGNLSFSSIRLLAVFALMSLVVGGVAVEIPMGRENLAKGSIRLESNPEFQASRWIKTHTVPQTIVASRLVSLLHHYSGRRVIWFPPITDPGVLMRGIRKHQIQYVIVVDRGFNYYLPPDPVSFDLLSKAYPQAFQLAYQNGQVKIYEVLPDSSAPAFGRELGVAAHPNLEN